MNNLKNQPDKNNLILIHGALGNKTELAQVEEELKNHFNVIQYEIPHHGQKATSTISFDIPSITADFLTFLEQIGPSYIYGFSLGGYIALSAAQIDEKNMRGIITQGTKLDWTPEEAKKETKGMAADLLAEHVPSFYEYLKKQHGAYLPELLAKTVDFMHHLGSHPSISKNSVKSLSLPVRMTRGGRDKMVNRIETLEISTQLKNGCYFEIPYFIHPVGFLNPKHVARLIKIQLESMSYQWIKTSHGKMAFKLIGETKNMNEPLVLFLHEAIGSIAQWQGFPEQLCNALHLPGLVIEFPGYGFSDSEEKTRDAHYLHEFALDYLPEFLNQLEIENPLFIVGHSDGGTNALLYSSQFPTNVKGIVTMAAHYLNESVTRAGIQPAIDAFESGKLKGLELFHGKKTERLFYAWSKTWLEADFKNWDISKDIKGNSVPALIIQGENDQYGTDQQVHGIVVLLENAEPYFIPDCGHAPHIEKRDTVISKIKEWTELL